MVYGTVRLEVTQVEDVLNVVWPQEYVLVIATADGVDVVTGTIDVLVPWLVETVCVVIVTRTTVVEGVLVVTGAETGEVIVDMLQLGAAAAELGAAALLCSPPYPPYPPPYPWARAATKALEKD